MNSKAKGGRGERELAGILRAHGYESQRNDQQYVGGLENPDVSLPGVHVECKRTEALRLYDAMDQAARDANGKALPVVMHRRNHAPMAGDHAAGGLDDAISGVGGGAGVNLTPFDKMTPERHRELSTRGGVASGEKRRQKAALRKALSEAWEKQLLAEGWIDDLRAYRRWKKRRDKARRKRG